MGIPQNHTTYVDGAPVETIEQRTERLRGQQAAATAASQRAYQERRADHLRERGWICIPPDAVLEDELPQLQPWAARGVLDLMYGSKAETADVA